MNAAALNTEMNFDREIVAGSTKKAMAAASAGKRDLWMVSLDSLRVLEGFNVRVKNADYAQHIRALADSIKMEGFFAHEALAGYVANEDGVDVVYITDGHCRREAALLAVSEGAELERLPVIVAPQGTSKEDLTVALLKTNTGKPLTPYETGIVCSRLIKMGWDVKHVAERLNMGAQHIDNLLSLVAAPAAIRDMVINGQVSASNAVTALKAHGDKAAEKLQSALARATGTGAKKVTAKHMGSGNGLKKFMGKASVKVADTMQAVMASPAFASMDEALRQQIEALMAEINDAKAKDEQVPTVGEKVAQVVEDAAQAVAEGSGVEAASAQAEPEDVAEAQAQAATTEGESC